MYYITNIYIYIYIYMFILSRRLTCYLRDKSSIKILVDQNEKQNHPPLNNSTKILLAIESVLYNMDEKKTH